MKIVAATRDPYSGSRLQKILPYFEPWAKVSYVKATLPMGKAVYNLARSAAPSREQWATQKKMNPYYFRAMSVFLGQSIPEQTAGRHDVVLMFEALYSPGLGPGRLTPYVIYDDCTTAAALERWPDWVPATARTADYHQLLTEYYRGAARILTSNELTRRSLIDDYGVAPAKAVRIGQGCDWGHGASSRACVVDGEILFVGYEFERKGGETLLEAFREVRNRVPHATLRLVGPKTDVTAPGVTVVRPGHNKESVRQLYERAAVFVLPSIFDPMPNAAMEAMAMGVPTVVADGCGTVEIVTDGKDAVVVPAGDATALANRLTRLLLEPDYRAAIGTAGAETIRHLTWEKVAESARKTLEEVVNESSVKRGK
jgi:glycosyltransferase involved in cell wall biosynthesis